MLREFLDRFRRSGAGKPRSKSESEKRRRYLVVLLIVLAIVVSVSVLVYGYYDTNVQPWHQRIVKVNDKVIDMRALVKMMRLYGGATNPSADLAKYVATALEDNELMKQGLENEFPEVDINEITSKGAIEAKLRGMLVSENATDEEYQEQYDQLLSNLKKIGLSKKDLNELYMKPLLIQEELKKQIGDRDYPAAGQVEHARMQAILVKGLDNAKEVRNQWVGAGNPDVEFQILSSDSSPYSPVKSYPKINADNTTAEWVPGSIETTAFDNFTFSQETPLLTVSDPIRDGENSENYWVIKVQERANRSLSERDRDILVGEAFGKWLEAAKNSEDNNVVRYLEEEGGQSKLNWAVAHVKVSGS